MSYWFITGTRQRILPGGDAIYLPDTDLPDFSRALSQAHLREWVKQARAGKPPESIDDETEFCWRMFSLLQPDDHVIAAADGQKFCLGEVTGEYRYEKNPEGGEHIWPVRWIATDIPADSLGKLRLSSRGRRMREISGEDARLQLRRYFPSWKMQGYLLFRWVSVVLLLAELVYFWPRK